MELNGRKVLLTGASGGIGAAIARELASAGAKLTLTARRTELIEQLATEVGGTTHVCDLADRTQLEQLLSDNADTGILVANAGLPGSGHALELDQEYIDKTLEVNLRAPIRMARALAPQMRERGGGQIVLISSIAGKVAPAGSAVYSATKFGLRGFAHGLRGDLHGSGVGVSVICPGFIRDAGMFHDSGVRPPKGSGSRTPEQVAKAVRRAIERDVSEIDVAAPDQRIGGKLGALAPELTARLTRKLGGKEFGAKVAAGQRDKS